MTSTNLIGFDEYDPDFDSALVCHIELDVKFGNTSRETAAATANAMRAIAAKIESGELNTGHHPAHLEDGQEVGEVYLDFYGIMR